MSLYVCVYYVCVRACGSEVVGSSSAVCTYVIRVDCVRYRDIK